MRRMSRWTAGFRIQVRIEELSMIARMLCAVTALSFVAPAVAAGQSGGTRLIVQGAVGSQIDGGGDNQSLSVGIALGERVEVLVSGERIYLPTEVTRVENGQSVTRHGTVKFISGELRFSPFRFRRVTPYVVAGAGRGRSRPNVNEFFPDPVSNDAIFLIAGAGVRIPVRGRLSVIADLRFVMMGEYSDDGGVFVFGPVRGGLAWRF
jgi:hypothetical protein